MRLSAERLVSATPLTRRDVLKGAAGLATLGLTYDRPDRRRDRVAIVGAGTGGVAAAYFLGGRFDVDVFEARSRIGGHCDSRVIDHAGQRVTVDLGAQFFHPDTHPIYVTLLEELGLYDPDRPGAGATRASPGSLCLFRAAGGAPIFASAQPFATPLRAIGFAVYTQLARQAVLSELPWETTVDAWLAGLPLGPRFKANVLAPWITATIGAPRADALRSSARAILQTFALAFPENVFAGATTYTSRLGLQGNLQRLLDRTPARVRTGTPVLALRRHRAGWFLRTTAGRHGPYRYVVLNAPPRAGRDLLHPLPAFAPVAELLDAYETFASRVVIHADPAYVHPDRATWAVYNAAVDGLECEGSAWLGGLHERLPSGGTVDVFKSWAQRRRADPADVRLERRFTHPLITGAAIEAARGLRPWQGRGGLYFSGQYTTGMDLQESAVFSAMRVAGSLAPRSPTLASLQARLAARGRAGVAYDL